MQPCDLSEHSDDSQCCVCCEKYDVDQHIPKVLLCGHVCCLKCLRVITRKHCVYTTKCPLCRYETTSKFSPRLFLSYIVATDIFNVKFIKNVCKSTCYACNVGMTEQYRKAINKICTTFPMILFTYMGNSDVISSACHAIGNLSCNENCTRLTDVCQYITTNLFTYIAISDVISFACHAIANLTCNNENRTRLTDVCQYMPVILSTYMGNSDVISNVCRAIGNLSCQDENRTRLTDVCQYIFIKIFS